MRYRLSPLAAAALGVAVLLPADAAPAYGGPRSVVLRHAPAPARHLVPAARHGYWHGRWHGPHHHHRHGHYRYYGYPWAAALALTVPFVAWPHAPVVYERLVVEDSAAGDATVSANAVPPVPATPAYQDLGPSPRSTPAQITDLMMLVYPERQQSLPQMDADRASCRQFATGKTGFDANAASRGSDPVRWGAYRQAVAGCLEGLGYVVR